MRYEDLPIEQYKKKSAEYEERGLAIPNGVEVELTDWAKQKGLFMRTTKNNPEGIFTKVGNGLTKQNLIKVLAHGSKTPQYYWAGFWKQK